MVGICFMLLLVCS